MKNKILTSIAGRLIVFLVLMTFGLQAVTAQTVLNNNKVRIGNGTESSINSSGNMQQPFYYNQTLNLWRKLTYSSYPLDNAFATGGSGTNEWNINGTLVQNPVLTGQVMNYSQYVSTGTNMGYGKIISTGNITIGAATLKVEYTYTLGQNSSFIQVKCKVTNVGTATATNVRTWLGTRDDYVGNNDGPTKTRGNLVNGAFAAIPSTSVQAKALKIESGVEGVLFYTTHPRAHTSINWCCDFTNAINTDPLNSVVSETSDNSYAMYVRFNDLPVGASDEFSLYYAAGGIADLEEIINEVAQASGAISNITTNSGVFTSSSPAATTGYYVVVPQGAAAPTAAQIQAGTNYGTTVVANSGTAAMAANASVTYNLTGLAPSTPYTLYFVSYNGTAYSTIYNANFTTLAPLTATISSSTNIACNGGTTGAATVTGAGASPPYTYLWSNAATTATLTGLAAGTYTVTVTDSNNQTATQTVTITQPAALVASKDTQTNVSCNGGSNGSAAVTVTGGTGNYIYSWAPSGGTAAAATGLAAGTYTVTVTDANSCQATQSFTITQPSALVASKDSQTNVSCNGGSNGSAAVTVTGGTGNYTYSWSPSGGTAATATGLAAGTYTVTVTDANSCRATQSFTITQPSALAASKDTQSNVSCNGGSNGSAAVTVTGGTGNYTYSWAPSGGTAAAATGLAAGTYTVTVTDANSCQATQTFTITQPSTLVASKDTQTNVSCNGGSNGSAAVIVTGGTGNYTYSWSPSGGTAAAATGLAAGTYTVTVTDANSCQATQSFTITQPSALAASKDTQTNVSCNGGSNGSAAVTVTGGTGNYTYSWAPSGGTAAAATGLAAGTYTVTVTDANSCKVTQSFTITQPSALAATTSASNVSCPGHYDGNAAINVTGGTAPYTYLWNNGAVTNVITGLTAGVYVVKVIDANGCQIEKQVFVNTTPDTTAPAPNKVSLPTITKECAVTAADIPVPTANDNCVGTVMATTTDELIYTEQGTYTITWTYNDRNGNRSSQLQTVIVKDITKPIPAVSILPTITKECAVTAADIPVPTANDNCAGTLTATTTDALTYSDQGSYTINWTYNDGNGNVTTQQQTIVVKDITKPIPAVAILPTITRECKVKATDIPVPTATDNCMGVITATTTDALVHTEQGTYTINWTYNDGNGNVTTQQQTIVVDDVTKPLPATASLPTITRECGVTAADIPLPTANDNCAGTLTGTTTDALTYSEQGSYTINWMYNDGNGNTTTQQQTIVVDDVTAPVPTIASLPTITKECVVTATDIPVPTATDNCVGIITATTTDALIYAVQGTYTINWTYNDGHGNVTTQQQTIVVDDITKPVPVMASLPTITRECAVTATDIPVPTATDNCVGVITATTTDALTYTVQGTYTINWTYNDGNGNTTTQQQTIVVDDVTAPVPIIASLPTITRECLVTAADIPVPTANDNCVGMISATTTDPLVYTQQGTYTINWTYNDGNGNTTTQQQTIVVDDVTKPVPVIASLPTITRECAVSATDIPVPNANDNCVGMISATTTDPLVYTEQGTYTINWTYNDGNGNTATQQQTIIVDDVTKPVPAVAILPTITRECAVTATDIPVPTATDNCVGVITATTTDALIYTVQGTYTINWTYNDGNGNVTTQQQTIVVDDITKPVPVMASLPTITRECLVTATDVPVPTAIDNCSGIITATTTDALIYAVQGTYTINWTYDDGNGNTTTQQQTIVVDDVTAPVPTIASLPTITRECLVTATDIPVPNANDNCVGMISATTTDPLIYAVQGTYTINWTYNDGNGNVTTQQQTIVVDDVTKPVPVMASLPTITRECAVIATDIPVPTAVDNCSGTLTATTTDALAYTQQGTYTVNWTYNDGNGNTATQQQTIIVDDITKPVPVLASLPTITRECAVIATDIPVPTAVDNCSGTLTATTTDALAYTQQGTYTVNWTYNDGNGNTFVQQQTVIVEESPLADILLNDLTTVYDGTIHKLMVDNLPAGAAVSYNITPQAEEANGAVNAGTYIVTAVVTPPASAVNCEAVTLTAELVIEKANQDILFNELEVVQLEDAENFQLSAVASSGLPVTYTYTYDQSTPAATVSPQGWVEIIHSGTVLITAQQQGNSNYLPAVSVERRLTIESKDASIQQIVINGVVYTDPDAVIYYMMDCNDTTNEVPVQIDAEYGATVSPARDFVIGIPKPGVYRNTVEVVSEDGTSVQRYQIIVERPFAFDDIVVQKFDNTLLINNNPQTNGGYRFVKYEWYRNDVLIGTEQVYSAGNSKQDVLDENALYSAILTTENGDVIHTCASEITRTNNFKINVYPNPVRVNEQLEVVFDYPASAFKGATAALYTTSGKLLQSVKLNENVSSVKLPAGISEGIYMLVLQIEGRQETVKIVVKQ